jgi:lysophospholipase L1-like esterase
MREKSEVKLAGAIAVAIIVLSFLSMFAYSAWQIRVACVGDSITENYGYPDRLQQLLGNHYNVRNFGHTGSFVIQNSWKPYINSNDFYEAKDFLPNIVVIMLGTNDAHNDLFSSIGNFKNGYETLIKDFQELGTKPKIFLVLPPPLYENELGLNSTTLTQYIIPTIQQIATEKNLSLIDVYSKLANHPEYFIDGVHPTREGMLIITDTIKKALINTA